MIPYDHRIFVMMNFWRHLGRKLESLSELLGASLIQSLITASRMNDSTFDGGEGFVGIFYGGEGFVCSGKSRFVTVCGCGDGGNCNMYE